MGCESLPGMEKTKKIKKCVGNRNQRFALSILTSRCLLDI